MGIINESIMSGDELPEKGATGEAAFHLYIEFYNSLKKFNIPQTPINLIRVLSLLTTGLEADVVDNKKPERLQIFRDLWDATIMELRQEHDKQEMTK